MGFTKQGNINVSTPEYSWRLVYENLSKVIYLQKQSGITRTQYNAYQSVDFKEIISHILITNLNYHSIKIDDFNTFYTEAMEDLESPQHDHIVALLNNFQPTKYKLVYDETDVIHLSMEPISVASNQTIFTADDIETCFDKIYELGLNWNEEAHHIEMYPQYFNENI